MDEEVLVTEESEEAPEFQFATVGNVSTTGITLIFDGQEEPTEKEYRCNTVCPFSAGDRVKVCKDSGTYVVEYIIGTPSEDVMKPVNYVPTGGTKGQVLAKYNDLNFSCEWITLTGLLPTGGSNGQVLAKSSDSDYAVKWADAADNPLPAGGSDGQVLVKDGTTDYKVKWKTMDLDVKGILPTGGTSGQVLTKSSSTDYAASWTTLKGLLPTGGTDGQVLTKSGATDYSVKWSSFNGLPSGGSAGQVLTKSSLTDYAVSWTTLSVDGTLPTGGSSGQVLVKSSSTNYATKWASAGLPTGGTSGQVLTKSSSTDYAVKWADAAEADNPLPTGGTSGQVLMKSSSTNYAVKWGDVSATKLASGSYSLTLSSKVLTPSATGFSIGTSSYPVSLLSGAITLYYSSYKYCKLTCNSSGKFCVDGTALN